MSHKWDMQLDLFVRCNDVPSCLQNINFCPCMQHYWKNQLNLFVLCNLMLCSIVQWQDYNIDKQIYHPQRQSLSMHVTQIRQAAWSVCSLQRRAFLSAKQQLLSMHATLLKESTYSVCSAYALLSSSYSICEMTTVEWHFQETKLHLNAKGQAVRNARCVHVVCNMWQVTWFNENDCPVTRLQYRQTNVPSKMTNLVHVCHTNELSRLIGLFFAMSAFVSAKRLLLSMHATLLKESA